ncbi:MAG: hypothetical protein ABUL44_02005, partial [Flavobacterium sp.]
MKKLLLSFGTMLCISVGAYAQPGSALNFDGINDFVAVGNAYPATDNLTYEAWIKPTNFGPGYRAIIDHN